MAKINEEEQVKIKNLFEERLENNVNILFFTKKEDCEYCSDTQEILSEVTALDERINLEVHLLGDDKAVEMGIDRAPATIFVDNEGNDMNVHLYGIPSGYEFNTLIEDIVEISKGTVDLPEDVKEKLKGINKEVLLQVFVTPTCPYCPRAVRVAHQMAMINPKIKAEMVESVEFKDLAEEYNVSGVPKTIINKGKAEQVGAVPAEAVLDKIRETI
ncbi:MAG: protein disulfide oxidoreductase [Halothermotrichaceae bacterium]